MAKALIYGFGSEERRLCEILEGLDITPVVVPREDMGQQVGCLCGFKGYRRKDRRPGDLPDMAMVLFEGLDRDDLDRTLKTIHDGGITTRSLKAMVTPTNRNWTLDALLEEIHQEQKIMGELMKLGRLRKQFTPDPFNLPLMQALVQAEQCFSGGEEVTMELVKKAIADLEALKK